MFEGIRGKSYMGDIALDDLDIADGNCPTPKYCDFEGDTCGWKNVKVKLRHTPGLRKCILSAGFGFDFISQWQLFYKEGIKFILIQL